MDEEDIIKPVYFHPLKKIGLDWKVIRYGISLCSQTRLVKNDSDVYIVDCQLFVFQKLNKKELEFLVVETDDEITISYKWKPKNPS